MVVDTERVDDVLTVALADPTDGWVAENLEAMTACQVRLVMSTDAAFQRAFTRVYGESQSEVFLGRDVMTHKNMSNAVAEAVDKEIRRIVDEQYSRARTLIEENVDKIEKMTKALIEWETLDAEQIDDIMAGREPSPPEGLSGPPSGGTENQKRPKTKPRAKPSFGTPGASTS